MNFEVFIGLKALAGIGIVIAMIVIGGLIGAIFLRLAALCLGFGNIPYLRAAAASILSNLIFLTMNASINFACGFYRGFLLAAIEGQKTDRIMSTRIDYLFHFSPIYFFYILVLSLILTAAIFTRMVRPKDSEPKIKFSESLGLTGVYYSFYFIFALLTAMLIFALVTTLDRLLL